MKQETGYFEEKPLSKSGDTRLLKRIFPLARPYRGSLSGALFLVVIITILDLALPYVTKVTLDRYIVPALSTTSELSETAEVEKKAPSDLPNPAEAYRGITRMTLIFLALILTAFGCQFLQMLLLENTAQRILHDLRMKLFEHIQGLPISFFTKNPVGRLVTRVTNDVQNMNELFTSVVIFGFKDIFLIFGIGLVMGMLNWKLMLICMGISPIIAVAVAVFAMKARDAFRTIRIKAAEINTRFSETVEGMSVIQLFQREAENFRFFRKTNHENYLAGMRQVHIFAIFMPLIEVLSAVALAVVIYFGGRRVIASHLTIGELSAFIAYIRMFFRPIRDMAEKYNIMQNALASAERIFQILDEAPDSATASPEKNDPENPVYYKMDRFKIDEIALDHIEFSYETGNPVLKDISIRIRSGETVAIVGPTGSGKTSLINLLVGFYHPQKGQILINGNIVPSNRISSFREQIALVTQEPFLFSGSIRENILFGRENVSGENLDDIVHGACLTDLVRKLPEGLDTRISERGKNLSSGERQLVSIARAFARDPELILLDEATSYVDAASEKIVQKALSNLMEGRTAVIIAHRLSVARRADRILVLQNGRLIEQGTHDALLARRGLYFGLYRFETA